MGGYTDMRRTRTSGTHTRRGKLHLPARRGVGALAVATMAAVGLVATGVPAGAIGVESSGVFELEATTPLVVDSHGKIIDSQSGLTSDPNAVNDTAAGDDWSNVYAKSVDSASPDADHATVSRFLTDVTGAGDDIFFQGGSKDPNNITSWKYTTGTVQDKNDIEHAYAARYDATTTPARPTYVYFGLDRFATAGDATLGFWFLKGKFEKNADGVSFGSTVHQDNDLLVQIDYTAGGAQPIVAVSRWFNGALQNLGTSNTQLCGASNNQFYCASTNLHNESAPWSYTVKNPPTGLPAGDFAPRTFFEGGVDLAHFGLDRECFSSFVAETRSSQSFTSTLSDFVAGNFATCSASETTTPSASTVSPGTGVTDTATITGTGSSTPPYPNSSSTAPGLGNKVKFYLCGPTALSSTATCTSTASATAVPADKDLTPAAAQGVSTATSDAVNTASNPLTPGRYCWLATWAGDTNYPDGVSGETNPANECFVVRTISTTTVTTPSDSSGTALSGTQPLGTTIYDKAVVTADASGGGAIGGDVAFYLCAPSEVVGGVCPDGAGTAVGDPSVTPVAGSDPPRATALSDGTAANLAGTWCFRATFTPTGSTYTGSGDGRSSECVSVDKANTTTTTTPTLLSNGSAVSVSSYLPVNSVVYDHAVVASANPAAGAPTGTVHFYVCDPTQLDANSRCSTGGTDLGTSPLTGQADLTATANSSNVTADKIGRWCFRGEYGGDDNYNSSSDSSVSECFTVKDSTTATSAQDWLPNDSATVTASDSTTTVSGTISITLYPTGNCTGTAVAGQTYTSGTLSGTGSISYSTSNTTYKVSSSTSVSWKVVFTSSNENLVGSSNHCESTSMTITN